MKFEIRNPNFEISTESEPGAVQTGCVHERLENFEPLIFGFISPFDIRASDFFP
jgi:hypothetical protein